MEAHPKRKCRVPYRYIMLLLLFCCITIAYCMRVSWKLSLRHMMKPRAKTGINRCNTRENLSFVPASEKFFNWPQELIPIFSDAFIWPYMLIHIPAGILCVKYGGKVVLTTSLLVLCFITLLIPSVLLYVTNHHIFVICFRVVAGALCGTVFPSVNAVMSHWIPARERGLMAAVVYSGTGFGTGINNLLGHFLILQTNKWSTIYYFYGSILIVWIFFWHRFASCDYETNPRVGRKERRYLDKTMEGHLNFSANVIPWWQMCKSLPLWALTINEFGHQIVFRLMSKELRNFMRESMGFRRKESYILSSVPFLLMGVFTIIIGALSDVIINRGYVNPTTYRKICTTLGGIGPIIHFLTAFYAGCNKAVATFILYFGICLMSFYYAGTRINTLDLAPNFSGLIMGIASGIGSSSGIVSMKILQAFKLRVNLYGWRDLYWTYLGILAISNIIYAIFGSAEVQPWNEIRDEKFEEEDEDSPDFERRIDPARKKRSGIDLQALQISSKQRDIDYMFPEST